jgi:DNA-binding NtrC family response regulator
MPASRIGHGIVRVLLVDDQRGIRRSLALLLANAGVATDEAASGAEALAALAAARYDVVISDLRMDGMSGSELLRRIRTRHPELPFILLTAYGTIESAVEAMRLGAFDYLTKPVQEQELLEKIREACSLRKSGQVADGDKSQIARSEQPQDVVALCPNMQAMLIRLERVSSTDLSVLMTGETGTGKSRFARLIHEKSGRRSKRFVSVNCASVPEPLLESELFGHTRGSFTGASQSRVGLFEEADGGTIFFDEIDMLSLAMQAKLLSVLQDREVRPVGSNRARRVDVRVICAVNRDLAQLIERGEFRQDLFFRLNGIRLHLPPLRERGDDLRVLIDRLLVGFGRKHGHPKITITPPALQVLLSYDYPGNIRQLENIMEQMVVFARPDGVVDVEALPEELSGKPSVPAAAAPDAGFSLVESERVLIEAALDRFGSLRDVARELGIGRTTLWRKLKQHNIQTVRRH